MSAKKLTENKMGTMPLTKLLINMALPIVIAMIVQALYNVVDSIYVSRISESAVTALSLAFPVQNIMIGFATGIGVGVNALLSKSLGEGDQKTAGRAAGNGFFLVAVVTVAFALFGIFGTRPFFAMQSSVAETVNGGTVYTSICCIFAAGIFVEILGERLLQASGRTVYTLITQGTGAVLNIILDPVFIFGAPWLGIQPMGIAGAAVATVIGQWVAAILALIFNLKCNPEVQFHLRDLIPGKRVVGKILTVGVPSIIMVAIGSVMNFCMNQIFLGFRDYGETAAAVFGVYFKLQSFAFMPVFGLNNGLVPIVSYNYGARNKERMMKALKLALLYAMSIMGVCMVIIMVFAEDFMMMFNASPNMLEIGVPALRTISLCFIMAGYNIITISVFQSVGRAFTGMIVSLIRQMCVLVPVAYALAQTGVLANVWYSFPIAEVAAVIICIVCFRKLYKNVINPLKPLEN